MEKAMKKCPECAEEIQDDAVQCRFCGARFSVVRRGYCANCHAQVDLAESDRCPRCDGETIDRHIESTLVKAESPQAESVAQPSAPRQPAPSSGGRSAPSRSGNAWIACGGLALGAILISGMILTVSIVGPAIVAALTPTLTPTRTPTRTPKATATRTYTPTYTATPLPEEVTFSTLDDVPVDTLVALRGRLTLMKSTHCDITCGVLFSNPAISSQVITIFIRVAKEGVEPEPNQMKFLPGSYAKSDIQIRLDDGSYAYIGDILMVTGRKCLTTDGDSCITSITKMERVE